MGGHVHAPVFFLLELGSTILEMSFSFSTRLPHPPSAWGLWMQHLAAFHDCCRPSPWSGSVQPFLPGLSDSAICRLLCPSLGLQQGPLSQASPPPTAPHLPAPQASSGAQVQDRTGHGLQLQLKSSQPPIFPTLGPDTVKYPSPPYSLIVACCGCLTPGHHHRELGVSQGLRRPTDDDPSFEVGLCDLGGGASLGALAAQSKGFMIRLRSFSRHPQPSTLP